MPLWFWIRYGALVFKSFEFAAGSCSRAGNQKGTPMIPTPRQLFAQYERGEIEREELQALMAVHARELISEMEEDYQNPVAAWIEGLLARRAAGKLIRRHGSRLLREVLVALSEVPDFQPARHLWNADHPDVPLHCFLRMRRVPVFRILSMDQGADGIRLLVEHGEAGRGQGIRLTFVLRRGDDWRLHATPLC